jgi:hypothetical protein
MDPNFIPILFSQLAQHNQIMDVAKQQAQEEHDQQALLENRQKLFADAKAESDALLQESSSNPRQVFVRCQLICYNLDNLKVVPDSYEGQKEKEDVALLWRKLIGFSDKCRKLMTQEQFEQCTKCLDAIWMQGFIRAIAERLGAYNKVEEMKAELEKKRERYKKLRRSWFGVLAALSASVLLYLSGKNILAESEGFIVFVAIELGGIALIVHLWFKSKFDIINNASRNYLGRDGEEFWKRVKEKFNGIPTEEMLQQSWKIQEEIIKAVFGEPAPTEPSS